LRIDSLIGPFPLLAFEQIDRYGLIVDALEIQGNPDPVGRG
jgi:hypothetical protein